MKAPYAGKAMGGMHALTSCLEVCLRARPSMSCLRCSISSSLAATSAVCSSSMVDCSRNRSYSASCSRMRALICLQDALPVQRPNSDVQASWPRLCAHTTTTVQQEGEREPVTSGTAADLLRHVGLDVLRQLDARAANSGADCCGFSCKAGSFFNISWSHHGAEGIQLSLQAKRKSNVLPAQLVAVDKPG